MQPYSAKSIILASFFESVNLGDLLIAETVSELCGGFGEVVRVGYGGKRFDFESPAEQIQEWWDGASESSHGSLTLLKRARELGIQVSDAIGVRAKLAHWRRKADPEHKLLSHTFREADLLVLGGGNLLYDLSANSRADLELRYFADLAEANSVPMIALGIGIGPFVREEQARRATLQLTRATRIAFRDEGSLQIYKAYGGTDNATVTIDPVFAMPRAINPTERPSATIALNIVAPELSKSSVGLETYRNLIQELLGAFPNATVPVFSTDMRDYPFLTELVKSVGDQRCIVYPIVSTDSFFQLLGQSTLVIGSRMHTLILAFTQAVPFISLVWQPKVRAFSSIVGGDQLTFEVDDLSEHIGALLTSVRFCIEQNSSLRRTLVSQRSQFEAPLMENESILRNVIQEI